MKNDTCICYNVIVDMNALILPFASILVGFFFNLYVKSHMYCCHMMPFMGS